MSAAAADRNLLVGIIALQMDFIARDALITAMNAWVLNKAKPLCQILLDQGALCASRRSLLDALVEEHIKLHDGDPQMSLAALSSIASVREQLSQIADPDLQATLPRVATARAGAEPDDDAMRTIGATPDDSASLGLRFQKLRPHAKGGLGQISVALDTELDRTVALKEIQDQHADDQASRTRFVQEAEITGKLEHPGIIPVYALGHYADGRPFYAMRFIHGDSLKEAIERFYRDEALKRDPGRRALRLRELLRRFTDVCNAIAYAHNRGILHRDLKPGNVMLGPFGETLVLDWGMAKAASASRGSGPAEPAPALEEDGPIRLSPGSGSREETMPGRPIGTPAFMSPEQAHGQLERLGARSDIYSLGATLYCILTGQVPFGGADLGAVLRAVQRGEFKPPRLVDSSIDPSLESICLKSMALEPEDRYASARELAQDVERWLADEPVTARREPIPARARRWTRRHRTLVSSIVAALVVAVAGLASFAAVLSGKNGELDRQRRMAVDERNRAKKSELESQAVLDFFENKVLATERPEGLMGGLGKEVTIRRAIDAAEPHIAATFRDQPAVEASIRDTLGETYYCLGEAELAIDQFRRSHKLFRDNKGPGHPETLAAASNLAGAYLAAGRLHDALPVVSDRLGLNKPDCSIDDALSPFEESLAAIKAKAGASHPDTLVAMDNLALAYMAAGRLDAAVRISQNTLELRQAGLPAGHPYVLTTMNNLGLAYLKFGRIQEAVALWERILELGRPNPRSLNVGILFTMINLAGAYVDTGNHDKGLKLFQEALNFAAANFAPDHPDTLIIMSNFAVALQKAKRPDEAFPLFEKVLKVRKAKLGPDHLDTLMALNNLAAARLDGGQVQKAIPLFQQSLPGMRERLGPDHPDTLNIMRSLARAHRDARQIEHAVPLLEETLKVFKSRTPGPQQSEALADLMQELASDYHDLGRVRDALPLLEESISLLKVASGPDHNRMLIAMDNLTNGHLALENWLEAEKVARECLKFREKQRSGDWPRFHTRSQLGAALAGRGKYEEAEPLLIEGYQGLKANEAKIPATERNILSAAAARIVPLYRVWGKQDKAEAWAARLKTESGSEAGK
jgi:serine/threonine protein kinase